MLTLAAMYFFGKFKSSAVASLRARNLWRMFQRLLRHLRLRQKTSVWAPASRHGVCF
jgi:hypothetical protein